MRTAGIAATMLLAAALVTACGSGTNTDTPDPNYANPTTEGSDPTQERTSPDPAGQIEEGSDDTNGSNDTTNANDGTNANEGTSGNDTSGNGSTADNNASGTILEGTGTYTGQIDSRSVEIETDEGPQAFQIDDRLAEVLAGLESGAKVVYEYTEKEIDNGGEKVRQLWLVDIRLQ